MSAEAKEQALAGGVSPLAYMLDVMRNATEEPATRLDAAKAAAPYIHPRLAAIEHSGEMTFKHEDTLAELE